MKKQIIILAAGFLLAPFRQLTERVWVGLLLFLFSPQWGGFGWGFSQGTWTRMTDFGGGAIAREGSVSFSIGAKGYMGTGYTTSYLKDFWEYDQSLNVWTQKTDFPGTARRYAAGFSILPQVSSASNWAGTVVNNASYGTVVWNNPSNAQASNNSVYSVTNNISGGAQSNYLWAANYGFALPAGALIQGVEVTFYWLASSTAVKDNQIDLIVGGVVQTASNKATGAALPTAASTTTYGSSTDTWGLSLTKADVENAGFGVALACTKAGGGGQTASVDAILITVYYTVGLGKGYVGTGSDGANKSDFYEYDPATNTWTAMTSFPSARLGAVGFSIGQKGYIGTGNTGSYQTSFYEYDPAGGPGGTWTLKTAFPGVARAFAVGFGISSTGKGYIGTGWNGATNYTDFYEYDQVGDSWMAKANFTGAARRYAAGFSIGAKGYIGCGYGAAYYADFYEYTWGAGVLGGSWVAKTAFPGTARLLPIGFSIGTKGYIGTGTSSAGRERDFYEYDQALDQWTKKTSIGALARGGATGFSIGNYGYVGCGYIAAGDYKDFWEYDQAINGWRDKQDFAGTKRRTPVSFANAAVGYLGTGFEGGVNTYHVNFYEYDPATNTWTAKANFAGVGRNDAAGFFIGTKGYIGTGYAGASGNKKDFWEYTPGSPGSWTQQADFPGDGAAAAAGRTGAVGFSIGSYGYMGTGQGYDGTSTNYKADLWEYDPANNRWTQKTSFPGATRRYAVGVATTTTSKGYIGTGQGGATYNDFYEFDPTDVSNGFDAWGNPMGKWTQMANFGGTVRRLAAGFTIGDCVYLGTGEGPLLDFWKWCPNPLPIELLSFTAQWLTNEQEKALLTWSTATEINNDYFTLERSADGINFSPVAVIDGAGNSSSILNYQYIDNTLPEKTKADVFYYRLKQTDFNGQFSYSNIAVLTRGSITVIGPSPNPISDELNFTLVSAQDGEVNIIIYDMLGQLVTQNTILCYKGIQQINIPLSQFASGAYMLHISTSDGEERINKQFVVR